LLFTVKGIELEGIEGCTTERNAMLSGEAMGGDGDPLHGFLG